MKKIIKVVLLFFTLNVYSQDSLTWKFKYSGYADFKTIKLPNGGKISNLFNNGTWEDSLGNYGKGYCYGLVESNNNKDGFFQFYCELSDQDKDKIFMKGSRKSEDQKNFLARLFLDHRIIMKNIFKDFEDLLSHQKIFEREKF